MEIQRAVTFVTFALVLLCAGFGQTLDKTQAAISPKEKTLLAAVTESTQFKPADPRVAKAYRDLGDFYSSLGRYPEAEKFYTKRLELEEDALGRANPEIIVAVNDLARVNFAQMKYARTAELFDRALRILEREHGEHDPKLVPAVEEVAKVLQADSKYPEAEKYLRRAL